MGADSRCVAAWSPGLRVRRRICTTPSTTSSFTLACGKAFLRPRWMASHFSGPMACFCVACELVDVDAAVAVVAGGAGQTSGVLLHAAGALHSARPTATQLPLLESLGSPHHAQGPREAHWPQRAIFG